jgi:integrative and conjugative element protein (TIGR02256 family)
MQLLLSRQILRRLQRELRRGGRREIGGLLMGEHLQGETFRLVDFSVQHSGGTDSHFTRDPSQHQAHLDTFFFKTGSDFARFNYLGEWHSHPSFEPRPSRDDIQTMQSIVEDPNVGVNFLVLVIARLRWRRLELGAVAFVRNGRPVDVSLQTDTREGGKLANAVQMIRRFLAPLQF